MKTLATARRLLLSTLAPLAAFSTGYLTAGLQFATSFNPGLVRAFRSVGQSLFGEAVFGVGTLNQIPVDPCRNAIPTDPCRAFLQVRLSGEPGSVPVVEYDPTVTPEAFVPQVVPTCPPSAPTSANARRRCPVRRIS